MPSLRNRYLMTKIRHFWRLRMSQQSELLRKIRKQKKITQVNLCKGICPRSTYSSFESSGYTLSSDILFKILDRLNIKLDEFNYYSQTNANYKDESFDALHLSIQQHDLSNLKTLKDNFYKQFLITNDLYWLLISFKADEAIDKLTNLFDPKVFISKRKQTFSILHSYLLDTDFWGYFEFALFGNLIIYLKTTEIIKTFNKIEKKVDISVPRNRELYIKICLNSIVSLFEKREYQSAIKILDILDDLITNHEFMHWRILVKFYSTLYKEIHFSEPTKESYQFLTIYKDLGFYEYYDELMHYRKIILENHMEPM
ncbi:transcriptional activator, Rgg/GadR/MutR family domain-containing protein [Enterococcus phoeniculicola]|nr:transcriptional activator, Rgg/GadR/MutR family domain-containing protein [Enterococcus phoeniculicola]